MARFLLDENVDARLGVFLRDQSHDVQAIAIDHPSALKDREVLSIALSERRILLTADQDFGELVIRDRLPHSGVILLRLRTTRLASVQARLATVIAAESHRLTEFLVVTDHGVRPRRSQVP